MGPLDATTVSAEELVQLHGSGSMTEHGVAFLNGLRVEGFSMEFDEENRKVVIVTAEARHDFDDVTLHLKGVLKRLSMSEAIRTCSVVTVETSS